jgi:hypothetical protein
MADEACEADLAARVAPWMNYHEVAAQLLSAYAHWTGRPSDERRLDGVHMWEMVMKYRWPEGPMVAARYDLLP